MFVFLLFETAGTHWCVHQHSAVSQGMLMHFSQIEMETGTVGINNCFLNCNLMDRKNIYFLLFQRVLSHDMFPHSKYWYVTSQTLQIRGQLFYFNNSSKYNSILFCMMDYHILKLFHTTTTSVIQQSYSLLHQSKTLDNNNKYCKTDFF